MRIGPTYIWNLPGSTCTKPSSSVAKYYDGFDPNTSG
jgi:hypothetical protein